MSTLRTDYKDDVFTGKRKYEELNNGDGTISFNDVTEYSQNGDKYGAAQINELNTVVNNLDAVTHKTTDTAETSIADNDYFPFYDTSAGKQRKTLWSNTKTVLINTFAIKNHASNQTTYGLSSSNLFGHCKLYDDYTTNGGAAASGVGASSKALYDAYTSNKNAINTANGTLTSLQRTLATTNSNLATLTNRVNSGDTEINSLKSRVTSNERNITSLGTRASTLENEFTANGKRIYFDYKDGKYGYNTSSTRSASTFFPFKNKADMIGTLPGSLSIHCEHGEHFAYGGANFDMIAGFDGNVAVSPDGGDGGSDIQINGVNRGKSASFNEGDRVRISVIVSAQDGKSASYGTGISWS